MHDNVGTSDRPVEATRPLVQLLSRAIRTVRLYEPDHPTVRGVHRKLCQPWQAATEDGPVRLIFNKSCVLMQGEVLYMARSDREVLPCLLFDEGMVGMQIRAGLDEHEARNLLRILSRDPDPRVDYSTLLWEAQFDSLEALVEDEDGIEAEVTVESFSTELQETGDGVDPPGGDDYESEQLELEHMLEEPDEILDPRSLLLTERERDALRRQVEADTYGGTITQITRVLRHMAEHEPEPAPEEMELAMEVVVNATLASDDPRPAGELLEQAREMEKIETPAAKVFRDRVLEAFQNPAAVDSYFSRVEQRADLDASVYGQLLVKLGPGSAPVLASLLPKSQFPDQVGRALGLWGDAAVRSLVPVLRGPDDKGRSLAVSLLMRLATVDALMALVGEFDKLGVAERTKLVEAVGRSEHAAARRLLLRALDDDDVRIRRAAANALRPVDAPTIAPTLRRWLDDRTFTEKRSDEELQHLFERISRVADENVAEALAQHCATGGLRAKLRGLTPIQMLGLRALRRMRDPTARQIVEELRETGPKAVREMLATSYDEFDL